MAVACKPLLGCWGPDAGTPASRCPTAATHGGTTLAAGDRTLRWAMGDGGSRAPGLEGVGHHWARHDRPGARCPRGGLGAAGGPDRRCRTPPHAPTSGTRRRLGPGAGPALPDDATTWGARTGTRYGPRASTWAPAWASACRPPRRWRGLRPPRQPRKKEGAHATPTSAHGPPGRHRGPPTPRRGSRLPLGLGGAGGAALTTGTGGVGQRAVLSGLFP